MSERNSIEVVSLQAYRDGRGIQPYEPSDTELFAMKAIAEGILTPGASILGHVDLSTSQGNDPFTKARRSRVDPNANLQAILDLHSGPDVS